MGRRVGYAWAGLGAALVWSIAPYSVTFAIGGLETSVYILLLTGMIYAHWQGRHILDSTAGLFGVIYPSGRPDLDRIGSVRSGWTDFQKVAACQANRRCPGRAFPGLRYLVFGLPTLAWIMFSVAYFGGPLPHSIAAKSVAYRLSAEEGFVRLLQHYATPFMEHHTFGTYWIAVGMALYPFLFLLGAWRALRSWLPGCGRLRFTQSFILWCLPWPTLDLPLVSLSAAAGLYAGLS